MKTWMAIAAWMLTAGGVWAALEVTVSPPQVVNKRALIRLGLKNTFPTRIETALAGAVLMDEQGKIAGQSSRLVIGGSRRSVPGQKPGLPAGATNVFYWVIPADKSTSTNLTAKVSFTRLVLEGGRVAEPRTDVRIVTPPSHSTPDH
jgi:hypothetical protein